MSRKRRSRATTSSADPAPERLAVFQEEFREDLRWWTRENPRIANRIWTLIEEILRTPHTGTGKPEPIKHLGSDVWSRRITQEHRLVSMVRHDRIDFLQARYHYGER